MLHKLKIKDVWYNRIIAGDKNSEVRINDRDYQRGDGIIFLSETGESERMGIWEITHVLHFEALPEGHVVLSIRANEFH